MNEQLLSEGLGQWPESQTLDFKQALPNKSDPNWRFEFLKDVSAFANADGGDLVYGVSEQDGVAQTIVPIVGEAEDPLRRRLTQALDAGLEPRVSGISMEAMKLTSGGFVWIVRVPPSFDGPHRYLHGAAHRFMMRNGTLNSDMSYEQVRTAFDRSSTLLERANAFRTERATQVSTGIAWAPLTGGVLVVIHVLPLSAFGGRTRIDVAGLYNAYTAFSRTDWGYATTRVLNLDGLLVYAVPSDGKLRAYTHVFRAGMVEYMRTVSREGSTLIGSLQLVKFVREGVRDYCAALASLGIAGPALVAVSLIRAGGAKLSLTERYRNMESSVGPTDRTNLLVPPELLETMSGDLDPHVKRILDTLFQCFDEPRCLD